MKWVSTKETIVKQGKKRSPQMESFIAVMKRLFKNKAAVVGGIIIALFILVAILGPSLVERDPNALNFADKLQGPSKEYWFGTDHFGRDIFSRIIHGARLTLLVGISSVAVGGLIGILIGIISGYYGKRLDTISMRLMDILLAFPGMLLALAIVSALGGGIQNVILAVALFSVPAFARIVRGSTLQVKKLEYIDAVRALGASDMRIIFRHILPNILSPIIVQATMRIATAILTASGLAFLSLGAPPPTPEWGAMLNDGRTYMNNAGHMVLIPGIAIVIVVLAFNIFGDGLRDALDPKMKK